MFGTLSDMRDRREPRRVLLVYANRGAADIVFRSELEQMESGSFPALSTIHILSRPTEDWHLTFSLKERRERRLDQPVWWGLPAKNTLDHATSMLPKLLYERLDDFGFDFVVHW